MMETNRRPMKVIHAPLNFAGQAYMLSQALRAEGVDSICYRFDFTGNDFHYADDRVVDINRDNQLSDMLRGTMQIVAERPDIVHFWNRTLIYGNHHADFFNGMDVPFLRLVGARLALRFTGYELRRKSLDMELNPYSPFHYGFDNGYPEDAQKRFFDFIGPYIDAFVVQDPEMQTYCPQARIIPRTLDLAKFPVAECQPNERPVVVHAPSQQLIKGSNFILKAADELRGEGLDFELRLIENMPNAEALEQYRRADIVVDQILVGWYGVLAMEAMAMGKTVLAHIRADLTGYFGDRMPLLNANPDTIKSVLRDAIRDARLRDEMGRRGRAFVEQTHDSRTVARAAVEMYEEILGTPDMPRLPNFHYHQSHTAVFNTLDRQLAQIARQIPAGTPSELTRKLELLANGGTLAELERKLGSPGGTAPPAPLSPFDQKLLGLVRRIPARNAEQRARKIASLLPEKARAAALADRRGRSPDDDAYLVELVRRIPAATPQELEDKMASLTVPDAPDYNSYLIELAWQILPRPFRGWRKTAKAQRPDGGAQPDHRVVVEAPRRSSGNDQDRGTAAS
jgi:hypothetical protein